MLCGIGVHPLIASRSHHEDATVSNVLHSGLQIHIVALLTVTWASCPGQTGHEMEQKRMELRNEFVRVLDIITDQEHVDIDGQVTLGSDNSQSTPL